MNRSDERYAASMRNRLALLSKPGPDGCRVWTSVTSNNGHARISIHNRFVYAHRVAYELEHGPIPDGVEVDHLCRVPGCINADHMELVSHRENVLRGHSFSAQNARKTHCIRGHAFTPENTLIVRDTGRNCRACQRLRQTARRARLRVSA